MQQLTLTLIVDASLGDDKKSGGLGAILTQVNPDGQHYIIPYASQKLQKHECNYTPFLLEMPAAIWEWTISPPASAATNLHVSLTIDL